MVADKSTKQEFHTTPNEQAPQQPDVLVPTLTPEQPVEQPTTPEVAVPIEGAREQQGIHVEESKSITESLDGLAKKLRKPKKKKLSDVQIVRDEVTKEVEHIMEQGLSDAFKELSPREAQAFKIKGEETAREIRQLLKSTKVKVKKIFALLYEWLKFLPGINSFFLEQEAKIKADKVMALHRKQMSHRSLNIKQ
jgi:hypothetical protein